LNQKVLDALLLVSTKFVGQSQKLRYGLFNRWTQIMILVQLEEGAFLVKLLALFELKFLEALIQKL